MEYLELVRIYEKLELSSKRLEKTYCIAELISKTSASELDKTVLLLQGKVFPSWDERTLGIAAKSMLKVINLATGTSASETENEWKKTGDLGIVAMNLIKSKKQATLFSQELTVSKVFENLKKIAEVEGEGAVDRKIQLVAELLTSAKPEEAKYIIRTALEELRVGVGEGIIRDAIVWSSFPKTVGIFFKCKNNHWNPAVEKCLVCNEPIELNFRKESEKFNEERIKNVDDFKKTLTDEAKKEFVVFADEKTAREAYNFIAETVQGAYDVANDFSVVAKIAREKGYSGLLDISLMPLRPIKVMLAQKVGNLNEGFETVGIPARIEFKYDGFRMQVHKDGKKIKIFTRRLEDVTKQFPEVVDYVSRNIDGASFIIDCEAVGFGKDGKYLPFQSISQRIKRKYEIEKLARDFPVELNVFDIIYYDGKNLIKSPLSERLEIIRKIVREEKRKITIAKGIDTIDLKEAEEFYKESLKAGNEGIMLKSLAAPYKPGSRVGYMVKLKPVMDSLDLVIVGAEWGEGKRANWLTSFTVACIDGNGNFLELGKVGTGIKEKESEKGPEESGKENENETVTFNMLTEALLPLIIKEKGREVSVKPKIVIEIRFEEIQKSPTYSSGFALRFPRLVQIREDRSPEEISTLQMVKELYEG